MRGRKGFSLVEILVAVLIIAALAAVLIPALSGKLRQAQGVALADAMKNLTQGISAYRQNVLRYPSSLNQLIAQPLSGAPDVCGNALPAANVALWRGPYVTSSIAPGADMQVGDATVLNNITRSAGTGVGQLIIQADFVDTLAAVDMERQFDGPGAFPNATGNITWTRTGTHVGTLNYRISIRGC